MILLDCGEPVSTKLYTKHVLGLSKFSLLDKTLIPIPEYGVVLHFGYYNLVTGS